MSVLMNFVFQSIAGQRGGNVEKLGTMEEMRLLKIFLLGSFHITSDDKPLTDFESDKARALLAYLAVEADRPHRREALAGLLWPDTPERTARTNLRSALANVRRVISDHEAEPPFLLTTRQTIRFNRASDAWVDVSAFAEVVNKYTGRQSMQEQADSSTLSTCIPELRTAVEQYQNQFLTGFYIRNAPLFEEWALITRQDLQRRAIHAMHRLTEYYQGTGNYEQALLLAQRQIELEPYQEAAHQQVMWALVLNGQRNEALVHYDQFKELLETELGVEPLEQTQAMHARILAGDLPEIPITTIILRREPRTVGECPYRGLAAFRETDAPFFYGREKFTDRLEQAVKQQSMVAVIVGSSGMGKSSVVYAGLLPRLREDGGWLLTDLRPSSQPFQMLASALLPARQGSQSIEIDELANALQEGEISLFDLTEQVLEKSPHNGRLLLFVDQFEELYTLCPEPDLRRRFLEVLLAAVEEGASRRHSPFVLLLTLRADFMGQALTHRPFADALQESSLILGPMNQDELRAAIEKPAQQQGAAFEVGLVPRILDDVGQEPGNLPLLEFALTLLWERLDQGWMTHQAYEEIGRVEGALARYAEEVIDELSQCDQAQQIFVQLVQPGEGTEDTRRVASRSDLGEERWGLVQRLADKRLVVTGCDQAGTETVEVVHEALIRGWERLRGWMDTDRTFRTWQESLRAVRRGWEASDRDEGALLRGVPLTQAENWLAERGDQLSRGEREFIQASVDLNKREQIRREVRRRRTIIGLATGLVIALILALLAGQQWQRADSASELAQARAATATVAQGQAQIHAALAALAADDAKEKQAEAEEQADARATQKAIAEEQAHLAKARELAMASISNLEIDPELSILLALRAVDETYLEDNVVLPEAEDALHKAVQASRTLLTLPHGYGVAFSPDGNRLATAGPDNTARLWDVSSGEVLVTFSSHSDKVMNIAFSPDGEQVATTSLDGTAKIWDAESGELLQTFSDHTAGLVSPAFSPDGALLATTSLDGTARIWDAQSGEELQTLPHNGITGGLAFSPDGDRLAIADHDAYAVKVWDTTSWQEIITLTGHTEGINDVVFNHDGSRLATASSDTTARIWDAETGEALLILEGHNGFVFGIDFSPDGMQVATGSMDATAKIWDAESGRELLTLAGHTAGVSNVTFSPDGKYLTTGSEEGAKIWDITPEGEREYLTLAGHSDVAFRLDYNPDGSRLATSSFDGTTRVWDLASGQALLTLAGHTSIVYDAKFNFDGSLLATSSYDGTVILWDAASGQMLHRIEGQCGSIPNVAFSPDGARLLTACEDGTAKMWDSVTGEMLLTLEGHRGEMFSDVFGVAFSPDGEYLATAGWDGTAKVWDAASGQELLTLSSHSDRVNHVTFSPNGQYIATASWDGTAKIWEIPSGREVKTLSGHSGVVWVVAFSPDGTQLATSSFDTTAKVWDFATGRELLTLTGHQVAQAGLAFSPDGRHLAVGGGDGTVRIYVLSIEELIDLAHERVTRSLTDAECQQYLHIEPCSMEP